MKPHWLIAPAGQVAAQLPQPWHSTSFTRATSRPATRTMLDGLVGTVADAEAAAAAALRVHLGHGGGNLDHPRIDELERAGGGRRPLGDALGDVLGTLAAAGDEHSLDRRLHRGELEVPLREKALFVQADAEEPGDLFRIPARLHADGEHHHVDRHRHRSPEQRVLGLDQELAPARRGPRCPCPG